MRYDKDGDGEVTKAEFMAGRAAAVKAAPPAAPQALSELEKKAEAALFNLLDTSGEGFLDGRELDKGNLRTYDANADGRVTFEEFTAGRAKDRLPKTGQGGSPAAAIPPQTPAAPAVTTPLRLPPLALKPGFIVGRVLFADGRPVPAFTVTAHGFDGQSVTNVNGGAFTVGSTNGRNGSYAIQTTDGATHTRPVNALVTRVEAQANINYNGQNYLMDLYPTSGTTFLPNAEGTGLWSNQGLQRDFILKISGLMPGKSDAPGYSRLTAYYGGRLDFNDTDDGSGFRRPAATVRPKFPRNAQLVVTFTPQGPLLDGSTGQTITRQLDVGSLGEYEGHAFDVPLGVYSVQAQVVNGGVATPLSVRVGKVDKTWTNAVTLDFPPSTTGTSPFQTLDIKL